MAYDISFEGEYNSKEFRKKLQDDGIFHTPRETCELVKSFFTNPDEITEVYDPTCGLGGLLAVFGDHVKKFGQELNGSMVEYAKQNLVNATIVQGDTLKNPHFKGLEFRHIIANFPFSVKWDREDIEPFNVVKDAKGKSILPPASKADYAFMLHMLDMLADDGEIVTVSAPGVLFRGNAEGKIREWLVRNNYIDAIVGVPEKCFVDTPIPTVIIRLKKNKTTTDIKFVDTVINKERVISFEEIEKNEFNLAIQRYVFEEVKEEPIDIDAVNNDLVENHLANTESTIKVFETLMETNIEPKARDYLDKLLDGLQEIIDKRRNK